MKGRNSEAVGIRELLSRDRPPTAIVAVNDMYALGAYAGARDLGCRVPEDLSIVGFDDIVLSEIAQPALTTIRQPVPAMADAIVRALIRRMEGEARRRRAGAYRRRTAAHRARIDSIGAQR